MGGGRRILLTSFLVLLAVAGPAFAGAPVQVFVSILPQKYFVQQIGGERVQVHVMVRPGASPATYEPRPRQMADLSRARLYFAVGVPFERVWLSRIASANPDMEIVPTDRGIEKRPMATGHVHETDEDHEEAEGHRHRHGGTDETDFHGILDPHIWLSPPLVRIQAGHIEAALARIDPAGRDFYQDRNARFVSRIDALDARFRELFAARQGLRFMVFHPSWGYFARAYGLIQVPIEMEGKDPKPAQLQRLIDRARQERIRVVFVQPQFSTRGAKMIARAIGGRVAVADPLAEDWMENLENVARQFAAAAS